MSQPSKLHHLRGGNSNLSREQVNHLLAVAGDHSVPEAEWVKACELLGPIEPDTNSRRRKNLWRAVLLGSGAVILVGAVVVNQFFATPAQPPTQIPETIASASPLTAPPVAAVPLDSDQWGPYMADLQRRIKRAWFPSKSDTSKKIVVRFNIGTDGSLSKLHLRKSSGSAVADGAALKAVENAAPFRRLPTGAEHDAEVEFTFDYNVFKGANAPQSAAPTDYFSSKSSVPFSGASTEP